MTFKKNQFQFVEPVADCCRSPIPFSPLNFSVATGHLSIPAALWFPSPADERVETFEPLLISWEPEVGDSADFWDTEDEAPSQN